MEVYCYDSQRKQKNENFSVSWIFQNFVLTKGKKNNKKKFIVLKEHHS